MNELNAEYITNVFLRFDPELARIIGAEEALVIQRIHELISEKQLFKDGRYWIRKSYPEWLEEFPFMKERTLRNKFKRLEEKNILTARNYNEDNRDRTKWYTINYDAPELSQWNGWWERK